MASAKDNRFHISDIIECAICLGMMNNPRLLPCQHTFCCACLDALVKNNSIKCPSCQLVLHLHAGGVTALPQDLIVNKLLSASRYQQQQHEVYTCMVCSAKIVSSTKVWFCKTCKEHLCRGCSDNHREMKVFINHALIRTDKLLWICLKHQKDQTHICEDHQVFICNVCVINDHWTCTMNDFKNAFDTAQKRLKPLLVNLDGLYFKSIFDVVDCIDIQKVKRKSSRNFAIIKKQIEEETDYFIERVKQEQIALQIALASDKSIFQRMADTIMLTQLSQSEVDTVRTRADKYFTPIMFPSGSELKDIRQFETRIETLADELMTEESKLVTFSSLLVPSSFSLTELKMENMLGSINRTEYIQPGLKFSALSTDAVEPMNENKNIKADGKN